MVALVSYRGTRLPCDTTGPSPGPLCRGEGNGYRRTTRPRDRGILGVIIFFFTLSFVAGFFMISHRKVDTRNSRAVLGRLRTDSRQGKERNGQAKAKGSSLVFFFWRLRRFNGHGRSRGELLAKGGTGGGKRKQNQALECVRCVGVFVCT